MSERINNCVIPTDRHVAPEDHVWAQVADDDTVTVGMTDIAQSLAKRFLHAHIKREGTDVDKGDSVATVESSKYVGPVQTPVGGEVVAVNDAVKSDAEMINMDPYGDGWVVRIDPDDLEADLAEVPKGDPAVDQYADVIANEDNLEECEHLEGSELA